MTLAAHIVVRRPDFSVDVELVARDGEVLALLGPNGAGKTTCLRALAGLEPLAAGRVEVDSAVAEDPSTGVRLAAASRRVGVVFADGLLFPHLSAQDNVGFGLRARGVGKADVRQHSAQWLNRVWIGELADRRPHQLSRGQAQRVALARALVVEPRLLLLDEPLSGLDAPTTTTLRAQLRRHLRGFGGVSVLVSHDPLDAMVLADRVVVLDRGRPVQQGSPQEVAARPRNRYVADLVGLNLLRGTAAGTRVRVSTTHEAVTATGATGDVLMSFRPSAVAVHRQQPGGSPRNAWPVQVGGLVPHGDVVRLQLDAGFPLLADVTPAALAALDVSVGDRLWAVVKATDISVYPA